MHAALAGNGTVHALHDTSELFSELATPRTECLVLDPALLTPSIVEAIATSLERCPRDIVAFSSVTTDALESAVVLAQRTSARFVFRGTPNERSALERALLLAPHMELHSALLQILEPNMERLPTGIRDRLTSMFRTGDGPHSPDAFAAATAHTRRSIDRYLAEAGLTSARRLIEAARIVSGYRAMTATQMPLRTVAAMLGYSAQRTLDSQLKVLLNTTSGELRSSPLPPAAAATLLASRLTEREATQTGESARPQRIRRGAGPSLTLLKDDTHTSRGRRAASGESVINS